MSLDLSPRSCDEQRLGVMLVTGGQRHQASQSGTITLASWRSNITNERFPLPCLADKVPGKGLCVGVGFLSLTKAIKKIKGRQYSATSPDKMERLISLNLLLVSKL